MGLSGPRRRLIGTHALAGNFEACGDRRQRRLGAFGRGPELVAQGERYARLWASWQAGVAAGTA